MASFLRFLTQVVRSVAFALHSMGHLESHLALSPAACLELLRPRHWLKAHKNTHKQKVFLYRSAHRSDARGVLFFQGGVEPTAAFVLQEAVKAISSGPTLAPPPGGLPRPGTQASILTALLGANLEHVALTTARRQK